MHIVDVSIMINNELYGKDKYIVPNFNLSFKTLVGQQIQSVGQRSGPLPRFAKFSEIPNGFYINCYGII